MEKERLEELRYIVDKNIRENVLQYVQGATASFKFRAQISPAFVPWTKDFTYNKNVLTVQNGIRYISRHRNTNCDPEIYCDVWEKET